MKNIGYTQKKYRCEVKRYCQTLDLKDNPELISEFKPWKKPCIKGKY